MVKTIPASQIDLYSLEENFGLKRAYEPTFFPEWPWGQGSLLVCAEPLGSLDRPHARDHGKELLFGKNRHFLL